MLDKRCITESNDGFTLVELLVVIAVIALLASLLLPSLGKSKYLGRRTLCVNNIRQQYLSQVIYADDFSGRFAYHQDISPDYHRTPVTGRNSIVNCMRGAYLANTRALICPIISASFGKYSRIYSDPAAYDTPGYGGWDTKADMVYTGYMWLANYSAIPAMKFVTVEGKDERGNANGEPAWPRMLSECDSQRAFITHRITETPGAGVCDFGHLGKYMPLTEGKLFPGWSATVDQPVGHADGNVLIRARTDLRPRAKGSVTPDTVFYY